MRAPRVHGTGTPWGTAWREWEQEEGPDPVSAECAMLRTTRDFATIGLWSLGIPGLHLGTTYGPLWRRERAM